MKKLKYSEKVIKDNFRYLKLLSQTYVNIASASTEIINLRAILNLPKGTEHFLADIHGEYEAFSHVLKNGSGAVRRKIDDIYNNTILESDRRALATLIYYPEQKMEEMESKTCGVENWYKITLFRLFFICKHVSSKYTRSKVRKSLPEEFSYIIEELLHEGVDKINKENYYNEIIETIIEIGRAKEFIIAISKVIKQLIIDRLHLVGDIFDRGPRADIVMDTITKYHSVDIQWGNHDILWMGAAAGVKPSIANVVRISARYGNLDTLEKGYGINLLPLATFALDVYKNDKCKNFEPILEAEEVYTGKEIELISKMHKAIAIIQFKLEGEIINRRSEFKMEHRLLLNKINYEDKTITLKGKTYNLIDFDVPTIDPKNPYKLTKEEEVVTSKLKSSFLNSDKLQEHTRFLFAKGSLYLVYNSNLLYHGCIPLDKNGEFREVKLQGKLYKGKALLDKLEKHSREGYFDKMDTKSKEYGMDIMWYLWTGPQSPLFGKDNMTTFERYFVKEKESHIEEKNPYYLLRDEKEVCEKILQEFGLDSNRSHIINGHVPVESKSGESPIKAGGKLIVIDGGFCRAYRAKTGIAGYTLIYNSHGLVLASHEPFESTEVAIKYEKDIISQNRIVNTVTERLTVLDTDIGTDISNQIEELKMLLYAYQKGIIKEKEGKK